MIKIVHREKRQPLIKVVVNMANGPVEAEEAGKKLVVLSKRFLNLDVDYMGFIPRDPGMSRAVKEQRPVMLSSPATPAAVSLNRLAEILLSSGNPKANDGNLLQFFKRVTQIFGGKE
jgi:flagellar biosynthesis protein FlhG